MDFLEDGLLKLMSNILRIKNNQKCNKEFGKLKKRIPSQVYFKNFVYRCSKTI